MRRAGSPQVAAVTMVRDEGDMLRKWVDHYGGQLGHDHLVVVDDGSQDGSTTGLPCRVERIDPIAGHFEVARMRILSDLAAELLDTHAAVVFADADEFVVPDPDRYDGLRDFVAARAGLAAVGVMGLNVVHHTATEPPLDFGRPFLGQRRLAVFVPLLCKPSVKMTTAPWAASSHGIAGASYGIDPDLYMFHFKFADRGHLQATADRRRAMVEHDGRAGASSWQFSGEEMVDLLDRINHDAGDVAGLREFRPPKDLAGIVRTFDNGVTRATGARQVAAMSRRQLWVIPERFADIV